MNAKLLTLAGLHADAVAELDALPDADCEHARRLVHRLRRIENEALPLQVFSFCDVLAKARIASFLADGSDDDPDVLAFAIAALVQGIEDLARVAPTGGPLDGGRP